MSPVADRRIGVDRRELAVRVRDEGEIARDDRRRNRDVAAARHPPDRLARLEVVAADVLVAVDHDLRRGAAGVDRRGAPRGDVLARRPPDVGAVLDVQRGEEGALQDVGLDQHQVLVDHGRAGELPLRVRRHVVGRVEHAEVALPERLAGHVEGVEPLGAEEREQVAAVGGERRGGVRRLRVALHLRHGGQHRPLPQDLPGPLVEAVDDPAVRRVVLHRRDVAVEAGLEPRLVAVADRRRDVEAVAPDDRARVAEAGDVGLPEDVLRRGDVPFGGQRKALGDADSILAAERGPVGVPGGLLPGGGGDQEDGQQQDGRGAVIDDDCSPGHSSAGRPRLALRSVVASGAREIRRP